MAREDADGLLCWLKGPALAVLLAVARDGGATHAELSAATGWARNTTYTALGKLARAGWVERDRRSRWLLTEAGRGAWAELTGASAAVPKNSSAVHRQGTTAPDDGTREGGAGARTVPENGTVGNAVPRNGRERQPVPENGTKKGKPAPRSGTARAKSVPRNGRKRPKRVPESGRAPYVNHDDHVVDDDQTSINNIIQRLEALPGPFGGAAEWAPQQERKVTVAWLEHLETAPPEVLARYTNPTGLLRTRVEQGIWPPRLPDKRPEQRTCAQCGHSMWDVDGSCLVCSGVVKY